MYAPPNNLSSLLYTPKRILLLSIIISSLLTSLYGMFAELLFLKDLLSSDIHNFTSFFQKFFSNTFYYLFFLFIIGSNTKSNTLENPQHNAIPHIKTSTGFWGKYNIFWNISLLQLKKMPWINHINIECFPTAFNIYINTLLCIFLVISINPYINNGIDIILTHFLIISNC